MLEAGVKAGVEAGEWVKVAAGDRAGGRAEVSWPSVSAN